MTKELKQQFTLRISQANKSQLVVILYEMMITYLDEAKEAYDRQDRAGFREGIRKSRGCLMELMSSLHFEYEVASNLLSLYLYANRELARADIRNSVTELVHVKAIMSKLHDAYEKGSRIHPVLLWKIRRPCMQGLPMARTRLRKTYTIREVTGVSVFKVFF